MAPPPTDAYVVTFDLLQDPDAPSGPMPLTELDGDLLRQMLRAMQGNLFNTDELEFQSAAASLKLLMRFILIDEDDNR